MKWKKILIVYYSRTGHTRNVALNLRQKMGCDWEELKTPTSFQGFFGFQRALLQILFKTMAPIESIRANIKNYDLVIVGGPIWAGTIATPVQSFLKKYANDIKNISFILTSGGKIETQSLREKIQRNFSVFPIAILSLSEKDLKSDDLTKKISSYLEILETKAPSQKFAGA